MSCRYRLGLDLGTSSLGWCCLDISNNEDRKILDMGVRIFPDGRTDKEKTPLCVSRREARGSRTRLRRFKMRQSKLIEDLQKIGLLPVDKNLFKDLEQANPYELRARAVKEKLSLFELGRVIFHLNQRRGFLNNRKEEKDAIKDEKLQSKKETKTQTAMNRLTDLMKSENCKTLGEFMFKTGKKRFKNPVDDNGKLQIDFYPNREMYIDEFEKIWNFQKQYYPNILTDEHKQIIENEDIAYEKAIENVYGKNIDELMSFEQFDFLPPYQELFSEQLKGGDKTLDKNLFYDDYMGRISNVSVHIALNQLRIIVNELIKKYGKPTEITIELGRDLTKGKKALADIAKRQRENAKIMDEARHAIRQQGVRITPFNIEKYKVWRNINPKNVLKRVDLYTGKTISLTDLFHGSYDIEHILPYSWTYDDSYDNKIITRSDVNRKKLNQLPYNFFTDESQLKSLAKNDEDFANMQLIEIKKRAKDIDKARGNIKKTFNFKAISWRFSEHAREIFNRNNKNMARDLGDMQYMSVLAKKYLTCICPKEKIISAKGILTDLMKNVWNITDTLPRDYELWQVQKWQRDDLIEKKVRQITNENPDMEDSLIQEKAKETVSAMSENEIQKQTSPKKDRSIHYHHALDAFTLANITTSIVQYVSSSKFANEVENFRNEKNENPDSEKQIDMKEAQLRLLKQSGKFYEKPYPSFNKEEFSKQLENIIVSYKNPVDKLKSVMKKSKILHKNMENFSFSSIHKAGAFGFREIVSIKNGDMEIKFAQKKDKKVPFDLILSIVVTSNLVFYTQPLLQRLAEENIPLIVCGKNFIPLGIYIPLVGNYQQGHIQRTQFNTSLPLQKRLWQQVVIEKVRQQSLVLKLCGKRDLLSPLIPQIMSGDSKNIEALAAKLYFSELFGKNFRRDVDALGINSFLNYGYAIVRACISRFVVGAGLCPSLALKHQNKLNPLCLVDDLMEPFRPLIDFAVFKIFTENELGEDEKLVPKYKKILSGMLEHPLQMNYTLSPAYQVMENFVRQYVDSIVNKKIELSAKYLIENV